MGRSMRSAHLMAQRLRYEMFIIFYIAKCLVIVLLVTHMRDAVIGFSYFIHNCQPNSFFITLKTRKGIGGKLCDIFVKKRDITDKHFSYLLFYNIKTIFDK